MVASKVPLDENMSKEVRTFLDDLHRNVTTTTPASIGAAGTTQTDWISGLIKGPLNQDYRLVEKLPEGITITGFTAKTASGTVTVTLKINSTAVTTGAIAATSSQQSVTPTAANVAAANDAVVLTCSAVASPVDLSFTIKFTHTLAS